MRQEYREALDWLRSCERDQLAASEDPGCSYVASQLGLAIELIKSCAVDPIPLSERLPGPDDLRNGKAWYGQEQQFGDQDTWDWCYTTPSYGEESSFTHWLPASVSHLPTRAEA